MRTDRVLAHTAIFLLLLAITASQDLIVFGSGSRGGDSNALIGLEQERARETWVSVGPSPIENCGTGSKDLCSGRVTSIAIDPNNARIIYIGGAQGGVWKSTNGGLGWIPIMHDEPSLAVGAIAIAPNGDIYVGTGEGNNSGQSYYGAGVLKSTDGGKTWVQVAARTFGRSTFTKIAVNPRAPNMIIASTNTGRTYSSTGGSFVDPLVPLGVYVSRDGGNSWTRTLTARIEASDLVLDSETPSTVYAAADGAVYISTDSGSTWKGPLGGGLPDPNKAGRINLGISASSHLMVVAAIEDKSVEPNQGRLYRTIDGGASWSLIPTPPSPRESSTGFCGDQCWYDIFIAVDPTDPRILYLGGLDLFRTTDGGNNWTDLGGYAGFIHEDQHAFAFSPTSHSTIYVGNDGGVWSSNNGNTCAPASCWINLNAGLSLTQFQSLAAHPTDKNIFFGGTQDNGTPMHTGTSPIWRRLRGGDGGWTAFDRKNPLVMYHSFQRIAPTRSDDGGRTWVPIATGLDTKDKGLFYIPMAMDPTSPTTLYLGTYRLYKTASRGDNWFLPSPGLSFSSSGGCGTTQDCIAVISVAPSNGQYLYVATTTGKLFVSKDGGQNFAENDNGLPRRRATKIAIDHANPENAFVTVTGFGGGHVFSTANAGDSWSDISSNLPDIPATSIAIDPTGKILFVGNDFGVYFSLDQGAHWDVLGTGLPRVAVFELVFAADLTLLAATHGRGVWRTNLAAITTEPVDVGLTVDGRFYIGPQLPLTFELGSTHRLQVSAMVPGGPGVRYVFLQWSDGSKELVRTITFTTPLSLTAIFQTQYELLVISDFGSPQGQGWYDAGIQATFSITSPQPSPGVLGLLGGKAIFQGWSGNSTATTLTASILMDAPKTVRAIWMVDNTQPYLILVGLIAAIAVVIVIVAKRRRRSPAPSAATQQEA